eukprot:TCONS_00012548-protein
MANKYDNDQPPDSKFNIDDDDDLSTAITVLVPVLSFIVFPFMIYLCYSCYQRKCLKDRMKIASILSLYYYIAMVASLVFIVIYSYTSIGDYGEYTIYNVFVVAIPLACFGYVFVLIESWCYSNMMGYLRFKFNVEDLMHYIQGLVQRRPNVVTVAQASHIESESRVVARQDSNGNTQYVTQTTSKKVISWEGHDVFPFNYWQDVSDKSNIPKSYGEVVRVKLTKKILFANEVTERAFRTQQDAFVERNKHRDDKFEFWTDYEISGFQDHILYYDPQKGMPFWMDWLCFGCVAFIGFSWPYRCLFFCCTKTASFDIEKVVSLTPISQSETQAQVEVSCVQPMPKSPPILGPPP